MDVAWVVKAGGMCAASDLMQCSKFGCAAVLQRGTEVCLAALCCTGATEPATGVLARAGGGHHSAAALCCCGSHTR